MLLAQFGYAIIPLDMAGHIAHNLFHLLAEGKSVWYTFLGLFGTHIEDASTAFLDNPTIQALQYLIIAIGAIGTIFVAYKIAKNSGAKNHISVTWVYAALTIVLAIINIIPFSLPMAMRM